MNREIMFAEHGNSTMFQSLRRQVARGQLEQVYTGIFVTPGKEPIENIIRLNWARVTGYIFPNGVITDRTGIECQPTKREGDLNSFVFVSSPKSPKVVHLPGLIISQRQGPGPLQDEDVPFMGSWIAGPVRRVIDNMPYSRARKTPPRTLDSGEIEIWLENYCCREGKNALNILRDNAKQVAGKLDSMNNFEILSKLIEAFSGTHQHRLVTRAAYMRATGYPIDTSCLDRIQSLYACLSKYPGKKIPNRVKSWQARENACFFESYFSNYIEGIQFDINEAKKIVFNGEIPAHRLKDAHDVLKIWQELKKQISSGLEKTAEEFISYLQETHYEIMNQRPDIKPGQFKTIPNKAGNTVFVAPEKVRGTLLEGLGIIQATSDSFSRAILGHYLISDVHPFTDGNGRLSRLVMNREFVTNNLSHAVIPIAFRNDYINGLRALNHLNNPDIFIRSILKCQEISAACVSEDFDRALDLWAESHAFLEDGRHVDFVIPTQSHIIEWKNGVPAPELYWRALERDALDNNPGIF